VGDNSPRITGRRELKLLRRLRDIGLAAVDQPSQYRRVMGRIRQLGSVLGIPWALEDVSATPVIISSPSPTNGPELQTWYQGWLTKLGLGDIVVPKLAASNRDFAALEDLSIPQAYRLDFLTNQATFDRFVGIVQPGHWTVTSQADRENTAWKFAPEVRWCKADVSPQCPRLRTPWQTLMAQTKDQPARLWELAQYFAFWWAHKALTGIGLDRTTWCWLATRFGRSALRADEHAGLVYVGGYYDPAGLARAFGGGGGRLAEVVMPPAA